MNIGRLFENIMSQLNIGTAFGSLIPKIPSLPFSLNPAVQDTLINIQKEIGRAAKRLPYAGLPGNLRTEGDDISIFDALDFADTEGIPLYAVPSADIALQLLSEPDRNARRKLLVTHKKDIIKQCETIFNNNQFSPISDQVALCSDGISSLRNNNYASAQALFTVLIDTLVSKIFPVKEEWIVKQTKANRDPQENLDKLALRAYLVWLALRNSHGKFQARSKDPVPSEYSRHVSVHGAAPVQYTESNCIQALMLLASLVAYAPYAEDAHTVFL